MADCSIVLLKSPVQNPLPVGSFMGKGATSPSRDTSFGPDISLGDIGISDKTA